MAKMLRVIVDIASDKVGELVETLSEMGAHLALGSFDVSTDVPPPPSGDDAAREREIDRKVAARNRELAANRATTANGKRTPTGTGRIRAGRFVVYTPAGTQRQIEKALTTLREKSVSAYVLKDLAKHPGSQNADVRKRLAKTINPESVDNAIWQLVNKGLVKKSAAKE